MGSSFFKAKNPAIGTGNLNMEARALNSGQYGAQRAGAGAAKDVALAAALNKHPFKPNMQSGAYPKGPKV
jgi:hypothetical protein